MRVLLGVIAAFIACPIFASDIIVTFKNGVCNANVAGAQYHCILGKNGITKDKHEGDGKTPIGEFGLRRIFYRADRIAKRDLRGIKLPLQKIKPVDGWCDDPKNPLYNTLVNLAKFDNKISHENLYRVDQAYNIIVDVEYNEDPVVPGKGSAIFLHVIRPGYVETAGCVAFAQNDLLKVLPLLDTKSKLIVQE